MKTKKTYMEPSMKVIWVDARDIIATSETVDLSFDPNPEEEGTGQ